MTTSTIERRTFIVAPTQAIARDKARELGLPGYNHRLVRLISTPDALHGHTIHPADDVYVVVPPGMELRAGIEESLHLARIHGGSA